ncbi:hypothetical protein NBRC111894_3689 [Sporolactobacillus inulinus]|nr:hypothetical protein [Sporolactobacillus inulinus]GAY78135.1 hypothetical protein NBRC111894_3689 [Sporolactobacillus inulinus]
MTVLQNRLNIQLGEGELYYFIDMLIDEFGKEIVYERSAQN